MINIEKLNFGVNTITSFREVINKNEPFVRWGVDNLFCEELYMLLDASPIHNSAIRARVDNSVGSGLTQNNILMMLQNKCFLNLLPQVIYSWRLFGEKIEKKV